MPYQGEIVSVPEMLDALIASGRTEHEAARELARALEDRAIELEYRNGHVFNSEDLAPVTDFIMAFPSRRSSISIDETALRLADGGAGAKREQFARACGLMDRKTYTEQRPTIPMTREEAVKACLDSGMLPADTVTWTVFCDRVRDLADGWIEKKQGSFKRGFDDKTIQRERKKRID
ncbi:hypothetical protein ACVWXM_007730 [Bradyrhizobium sp. GM7.3]